MIAGAFIVGAGLYQLYQAYKADFRDELKLGEMGARAKTWATRSGRLGYAASGVRSAAWRAEFAAQQVDEVPG